MPKKSLIKTAEFEQALAEPNTQLYVLRLCISGMTPRSREAILNIKQTCETQLQGQYELEVIDLYQQPELAAKHEILATPTLLKTLPAPVRRLIGDLSDPEKTLSRLGVAVKKNDT
ncbi:MAG: circadian clock KaiB family protein [Nitrospira sp.]